MHFVVVCSKLLYSMLRGDLYCSRARVRLCSPFRNYSVESFYNDVPECIGMKTFRKAREIHSFSMTFSSDAFLFLEGYFHKRCILTSKVILSYSCRGFMFYNLVYHDTPRIWWTQIWLWPALSVMSNSTRHQFMVFIHIRRTYTPRLGDTTLADQRTCVPRCR